MYYEDVVQSVSKKHKPHNLTWEQQSKSVRDKKVQERLKALRKQGRELKHYSK